MALTLQGSTTAVGENTFTDATVTVSMVDRGRLSVAFGKATFTAAADAPGTDVAFAAADHNLQIDNADFTRIETRISSGQGVAQGRSWAQETVQTSFLAVNIEGLEFSNSSITETHTSITKPTFDLSGNVAAFSVDVTSEGNNTVADVAVENIAVENQLSLTDVTATAAATSGGGNPPALIGSRCNDIMIGGSGDDLVWAGDRNDHISTGAGGDLIFAGDGNDVILAGAGDNTVIGGDGNDRITTLGGDDWIFAGEGNDVIDAGSGNDLIDGGDDNDMILCGAGNDVVRGGKGNDVIDLGAGFDVVLLGAKGGDGNDVIRGGAGTDLLLIDGPFGRDTMSNFSVREGDRLILADRTIASDNDLRLLNGRDLFLERSTADSRDLVVTIKDGGTSSVLTLDDFFRLNPEYAAPARGQLTDQQALPILHAILGSETLLDPVHDQLQYIALSDFLSDIG